MTLRSASACLFLTIFALGSQAVRAQQPSPTPAPSPSATPTVPGIDVFWTELSKLCGKAFAGTIAADTSGSPDFAGKALVMHVRSCEKDRIRIPFFVGDDRSRTWVLTRKDDRILLKHDHRHKDGLPDAITMYGGWTTNTGMARTQFFPADQETAKLIPAAASNIWWIDVVPGSHYGYNLRRVGTDRLFSVKFDLTKEVPAPEAPWGWKD
jgi:hypothetical protein